MGRMDIRFSSEGAALRDGVHIACLADGTLEFRHEDGSLVAAADRIQAIAHSRAAIEQILYNALAANQSLIRLDAHVPEAAFKRLPAISNSAPSAPRPIEPRPPELPQRSLTQWLLPPLWSAVKNRAATEHRQRVKEYRIADAAWERAYLDPARREQASAEAAAAAKEGKARALKQQLRVMSGSDPQAVLDSFRLQLQQSDWATLLNVRTALSDDSTSGTFTIGVPSQETFAPHCPPPVAIDRDALRLHFEALGAAELNRRYHVYLIASTLKVATAAFVAIPTLTEATLLTLAPKSNNSATRAPAIRINLTREAWAAGWQRPDSPLFELQRLRGTLVLPNTREPSGAAKVEA